MAAPPLACAPGRPMDVSGALLLLAFHPAPTYKLPPPPSIARYRPRSTPACNNDKTWRGRRRNIGVACRARTLMFRVVFDGQGVRRTALGYRYAPPPPSVDYLHSPPSMKRLRQTNQKTKQPPSTTGVQAHSCTIVVKGAGDRPRCAQPA